MLNYITFNIKKHLIPENVNSATVTKIEAVIEPQPALKLKNKHLHLPVILLYASKVRNASQCDEFLEILTASKNPPQ